MAIDMMTTPAGQARSRAAPITASSRSSRWSPDSASRWATRCAACCCRRSGARRSPRSRSRASRTSSASIAHVKEDVTEIILNIKELNVVSNSARSGAHHLDVHGPARSPPATSRLPVTSRSATPVSTSPRSTAKGQLRMDLMVERGKGYVTAERNKREGQPIGVIPIDAIFTPVRKANFSVEKTRVGQETEWDKLVVEVWTDGTIAAGGGRQPAPPGCSPSTSASSSASATTSRRRSSARRVGNDLPQPARRRADRGARPQRPRAQLPQGQRHHQGRPAGRDEAGGAAHAAQLRSEVARRDPARSWCSASFVTPEELDTLFQPMAR